MRKTYRLSQIGVLQTAKMVMAMYLVVGFFAAVFSLIVALAGGGGETQGAFVGISLAMLLLYPVMGFAGTAIACWFYNLIAARIGGIEWELEEAGGLPLPEAYPHPPPPAD